MSASGEVVLPPNAPPLRNGIGGRRVRSTPRRIGLEVGRLHPGCAQRQRPLAVGHLERPPERDRRPPALHLARCRARRRDGPPTTHPEELGTATSASPGAVSSANPPAPAATSAPTRWGTPPSISARLAASARDRLSGVSPLPTSVAGLEDRAPPRAPAEVGEQRRARRRSRSPRSEAASDATRMMIPGVQKPHWLAPVAVKAFVHSSRIGSGSPSRVVISRPATRATPASRTPLVGLRRPTPCSSRTGLVGCSRPSPSAVPGGHVARPSSDPASSGTVTGSPLTRSAIASRHDFEDRFDPRACSVPPHLSRGWSRRRRRRIRPRRVRLRRQLRELGSPRRRPRRPTAATRIAPTSCWCGSRSTVSWAQGFRNESPLGSLTRRACFSSTPHRS